MQISIGFSAFAMMASHVLWAENKPNEGSSTRMHQSFLDACKELKKREVLSMGVIESLFQAVINIYLFAWTPILQNTTVQGINVGFVFTCFVIAMIMGTKVYEIFMIYLRCEYYMSISISLLIHLLLFFFVTYIDNFLVRLFLLAGVNGVSGFFNPLNSIIKSRILVEKYRATLMSIFRIPLNLYIIIVLISLRYMEPVHVNKFIILDLSYCLWNDKCRIFVFYFFSDMET